MVNVLEDPRRGVRAAEMNAQAASAARAIQQSNAAVSAVSATAGRAFTAVLAEVAANEAASSTPLATPSSLVTSTASTATAALASTESLVADGTTSPAATELATQAPDVVVTDRAAVAAALESEEFAGLTTAAPNQENLGDGVVVGALDHLGTPYLWGGNDADTGVDCSGLVRDAFRDIGVDMPRVSYDQATMGVEVASLDEALPGDLLAFGSPVNHVAIYLGDNKMVHAPRTGEVVKVEEIDRTIATIRRVVDTTKAAGEAWTSLDSGEAFGPEEYQHLFEAAGERWNLDPALLASVAKVESNFDPNALSSAGASGLMQFMPATAEAMGVDPSDPASAIDGAAQYLRQNLDQFGTIPLALAAYNAGPGNVAKYGGIPPFDETQRYVKKVQEAWSTFAA